MHNPLQCRRVKSSMKTVCAIKYFLRAAAVYTEIKMNKYAGYGHVSDLRSSWFCFSSICFMSNSWLSSCLSCFSEDWSTDTCWFCIFSSLWLILRLCISSSRREVRCNTCKDTSRDAKQWLILLIAG